MHYLLLSLQLLISGGILYWLWIPNSLVTQLVAAVALLVFILTATKLLHDIVADELKPTAELFFKKTKGGN